MPGTIAEGTVLPAGGDAYNLIPDLRKAFQSLTTIAVVANVAARTAFEASLTAESRSPSATDPAYVHRIDALGVNKLEYCVTPGTWRPVGPSCGVGSGISNTFGQIAVPHYLGYKPGFAGVFAVSGIAIGDGAVTESATKDYTPVVWDLTATDIIVRFVNRLTNAWAGTGARFGVMFIAQ